MDGILFSWTSSSQQIFVYFVSGEEPVVWTLPSFALIFFHFYVRIRRGTDLMGFTN